jgi:hypothetical protein
LHCIKLNPAPRGATAVKRVRDGMGHMALRLRGGRRFGNLCRFAARPLQVIRGDT